MSRAIFVGGTASNVGKSWMATALCRLLYQKGIRVAPFKAQNMSNNSYPCAAGGEIGRSQVTQAAACGLEPEPSMNPVLLKPCGDSRSQVILHGKVWRTLDARDYYQHSEFLKQQSLQAFETLAKRFDVIVMEGAGSIAEINLAHQDFTNMSMARAVGAKSLLVTDIERGGVFASILGTLDLLTPEDRALIHCVAINRFRGDPALFADGVSMLEQRSGIPILGVFPFEETLHLDAEDSLSTISAKHNQHPKTAILKFPRISNTTDFRHLTNAHWLETPTDEHYEFIILPGTKSTIADLLWLKETKLDSWLRTQHQQGAHLIGICGGYQMLGESISDPTGSDGAPGDWPGLALLPTRTTMSTEKTIRTRRATTAAGTTFDAYEIHMGQSLTNQTTTPFATLEDGTQEGIIHNRIIGTYLHAALESPELLQELMGFTPKAPQQTSEFNQLAHWLATNSNPSVLVHLLL